MADSTLDATIPDNVALTHTTVQPRYFWIVMHRHYWCLFRCVSFLLILSYGSLEKKVRDCNCSKVSVWEITQTKAVFSLSNIDYLILLLLKIKKKNGLIDFGILIIVEKISPRMGENSHEKWVTNFKKSNEFKFFYRTQTTEMNFSNQRLSFF